jgi:4-amino-4-deoxy-L-arabinose transferase-like glycosyltransferase
MSFGGTGGLISRPPALNIAGRMNERLRSTDYLLLGVFCFVLFGYAMFGGSPLSLHSARLPECAREMMANHDWLIPRSGGRPWLERPPLPHWITIGVSALLGQRCDCVWVVRLPAALMGLSIVLMAAWMAGVGFGRRVGLCGGYGLATAYEFWRYSTLSEDDIFLAAIVVAAVALFVRSEFVEPSASDARIGVGGSRPWPIFAFFALTGLTNLAKGPLVGAAVVLGPVGVFLLWNRDWRQIRRYLWFWGGLVFIALTIFWPYMIYRRYPATIHNWSFDYSETDQYDQPLWYYFVQLPGVFMPWSVFTIVGLWITARRAYERGRSIERFLWCWAIVPVLILSIPHRKHHHYLVPSLAPWGILAGIGIAWAGDWLFVLPAKLRNPWLGLSVYGVPIGLAIALLHRFIPGPTIVTFALSLVWIACVLAFYIGLSRRSRAITFAAVLAGLLIVYCWGESVMPDDTAADTAFLQQVEKAVPHGKLLTINSDLGGEMDFFRNQFYVRADALLLHNLTYLRDENLRAAEVYVITRASDESKLETLGQAVVVLQSTKTRREHSPADRFTLFHLTFRPDLQRYPATPPDQITTMQAMDRAPGPWCGPPF